MMKERLNHIVVHLLKDFSRKGIRDIIENNKKSCKKQDFIILRFYFVFLIQLVFELKCAAAYA